MNQFDYTARRDSQQTAGRVQADNAEAARAQLESLGYEVLSLAEVPPREATAAAAVDERLPLAVVLETLADDVADPQLHAAVERLSTRLDAGESLDEALAAMPATTPRYLSGVLRSATSSSDLAEVCENFIRLRQASDEAWRAVVRVLFYPLVLIAVLLGLAFLAAKVVLPPFVDIYDEFELELSLATTNVISVAPYLPWLILGLLVCWVAIVLLPRVVQVGYSLRTALPVVGNVFSSISHEQFAETLAGFLRMRMPLAAALTYTSDLLEDRSLARATLRAADAVEHGTPLGEAMARARQFDRSLAVLVQWGEQRSDLAASLLLAAEMFVDRRRQRMQLLSRIVPPLTLVCVASGAVVVVAALFAPLVSLIEWLS